MLKIRRKNYCANKCIRFQQILKDTDIPAIEQNTGFQQIKIQKGGTPQFRTSQSISLAELLEQAEDHYPIFK